MLYEYILYLQGIELGYWKRGIPATLSLLKDAVKKKSAVNISFSTFAKSAIDNSDKKQSTKDNLHSTLAVLNDFRSGLDFKDITYTFLRDFEQYLREKGNADNTIAKHMKQLRILVNEAINQGYMHADAYPVSYTHLIDNVIADEFSWAMTLSICPSRICIFFIRRSRFRSTVFRQTKVYLLALDSSFVPSIYSTFRLMKPLEERRSTVCVNTSLISFFTRLRKRLMVMKSGFSYPASQI